MTGPEVFGEYSSGDMRASDDGLSAVITLERTELIAVKVDGAWSATGGTPQEIEAAVAIASSWFE